ncbi:hypothetical protein HYDPIDRAFT_107372 [Hydnomerulius pinastri MD-312]|nr:hypothetical protein HYDPIDRAFT_107372 [Hydnomerulius pinastri MD-312]
MSVVHQLKLVSEEWDPRSITSSFDWPVDSESYFGNVDSVKLVATSLGVGWGFSFLWSRAPKTPTPKKSAAHGYCSWKPAAVHFHPCANHMRRSCEGVVVKVETSFVSCMCPCRVCRGDYPGGYRCQNGCGCLCQSSATVGTQHLGSTTELPLTGDDSRVVPLVIDSAKPVSILQKLRLTVKVTILRSSKLDNFFDIRADVAARPLQWVNMDHDQSCIQREKAGVSALERSLKSGVSFDAKFLAYSRRLTPGHVAEPMPVYADTSVLKAKSAHLDFAGPDLPDSLKSLFASDLEGLSAAQSPVLEDYEYESDSDLDDDEVLVHQVLLEEQPVGSQLDTDGKDLLAWHALIFYCYTGQIAFCDLRSQVAPGAQFSRPLQGVAGPPSCSPKSMYRLADKLGIETLKTLSFIAIEQRLSKANILRESFSKFTSKFSEVGKMELAMLMDNRKTVEILRALPDKVLTVGLGKMPHAAPMLAAFYKQMVES